MCEQKSSNNQNCVRLTDTRVLVILIYKISLNATKILITFLSGADNDSPKWQNCRSIAPSTAKEYLLHARFFFKVFFFTFEVSVADSGSLIE